MNLLHILGTVRSAGASLNEASDYSIWPQWPSLSTKVHLFLFPTPWIVVV